jgi:hypothetical protein
MTTRFAKTKKFAGLTILAAAMSAAGLGLGSGTAQANTNDPCPPPHMMICNHVQTHLQRADNFFDRIQGRFGVGERTPFDNRVDRIFGVK